MARTTVKIDTATGFPFFLKDPDATLDYAIEWADALGSNLILTQSWVIPAGITEVSSSIDTTKKISTIVVSGGTLASDYTLECRANTDLPGTLVQSIIVRVRNT